MSALAIATVLLVAACGDTAPTPGPATVAPTGSGSPSSPGTSAPPAATSGPVATATPVAVDVPASFSRVMADVSFSASMTVHGTSRIGSTTTTTSGTLSLNGLRSHLVATHRTAGKTSKVNLVNDGVSLYRSSYGLWFAAGQSPDDDLAAAIRGLSTGVQDLGIETRDGQALHHLSIPPPSTLAAALDLPTKAVSKVAPTADAWTLEDGTPVVISLGATWDQVVARKTVHGTTRLDLTLSGVGSDVPIPDIGQLWTLHTSKLYHYRIASPDDWEVKPGNKKFLDAYYGFDARTVYAYRFSAHGFSLKRFSSLLMQRPSDVTGFTAVKVHSNKAAKLGTNRARLVEITGKYQGARHHWIVYFAVKGGYIYWVELRTDTATTRADRAIAAQFAASFSVR
jgi:hypothetical protein